MAKRTGGGTKGGKRSDRSAYVPDAGDLVWLSFTPQAGREEAGRRPALVLSPRGYNERVGLCIVCPVTAQVKGYPFEVLLPDGLSVGGAVLSDHLRSADWHAQGADYAERVPNAVLDEVRAKLRPLLGV